MSLGYHIGDFYDARGPETSKKFTKLVFGSTGVCSKIVGLVSAS